jgi:hypothetical protein
MLEFLRQSLEADAAKRGEHLVAKLQAVQLRNQAFWFSYFAASLVSFGLLLVGRIVATKSPAHTVPITVVTIASVTAFVAITQNVIRNYAFLNRLANRYHTYQNRLRGYTQTDYLASYRGAAWLLALFPSAVAIVIVSLTSSHVVKPGTSEYTAYSDTLKQLMTLTTAVLAAQVALFNFMFGQLLGRYSTTITTEIAAHPTVRLLQRFTLALLMVLSCFFLLGFPSGLPQATIFLVLALLSCLVLTVLVANKGIQADSAMRYVGGHIGRKVARSFGDPIAKPSRFWKSMLLFGLDWRNPERAILTAPPARPPQLAVKMVAGIFNAAHKALRDNEHEMFVESVTALIRVADSYATPRSKYLGTNDAFFSYMDDHLAVLMAATAKAPNQYLITNVVTTIGAIGRIALRLGGPIDKDKIDYPRSHPLFAHWFGLLVEGFNLSHTLMRSHAASEALEQMSLLANAAILAGHGEHVRVTVLPGFQDIHRTCIQKTDAYHVALAGDCLIKIVKIWLFALIQPAKIAVAASDHVCQSVQGMVLSQQALPRPFSLELKDPASVLSVKTSTERYTLQDICMCILAWDFQDEWLRRLATDKLIEIIDLLKALSLSSGADWASVKSYTLAIYEISFLILKGIPAGLAQKSEDGSRYHQGEESRQDILEQRIGDVTRKLVEQWYNPTREWFGCEHALFSVVGMAAVAFKAAGRTHAKTIALDVIERYSQMLDETQKNNGNIPDDHWDYLQLCAAWARDLLGEVQLADKLVADVAHGRPFYSGYISGRSSAFGYPQVELGFAFFLPVPRNLQISNNDGELFNKWQAMAVEPNMLHDTYERVWAIRGPLQDEIRSRRAAAKKKPQPPPSPPPSPKGSDSG